MAEVTRFRKEPKPGHTAAMTLRCVVVHNSFDSFPAKHVPRDNIIRVSDRVHNMGLALMNAMSKSHPILASVFSRYWDTPLSNFSSRLYQKDIVSEIDPLLLEAFHEEFLAFGIERHVADEYVLQLKSSGVIQTTHHVTPTNGPTFLTADVIALTGLSPGLCYLVGAISGLPFSNPALSGCLLFAKAKLEDVLDPSTEEYREALRVANRDIEKLPDVRRRSIVPSSKVSLIPARMRNALVYSSTVPDKLLSLWSSLTDSCRGALTAPGTGQPYSYWACSSCTATQRTVLQHKEILYFDMNRVVSRYLQKAISSGDHPLVQLLIGGETTARVMKAFDQPTLFLSAEQSGTPRVVPVIGTEAGLFDQESASAVSISRLEEGLSSGNVCPSIFVVMLALRFLNGIRCLGGYLQIDYLEAYRKVWQEMRLALTLDLEPDFDVTLTTGRIIENGSPLFSLDLALGGSVVAYKDFLDRPMSYFWEPIARHLSPAP